MSNETPQFWGSTPPPTTSEETPLQTIFHDQEAQQEARTKALADPAVREFLANLHYPQAAEVLPGMRMPDGSYACTLEQIQEGWASVEAGFRHAYGPKGPKGDRPTSAAWQAKLTMWSQQREAKEREKAERAAEREREAEQRRQEKAVQETQLAEAQAYWKSLVAQKKEVLADLDQQIADAHAAYKKLRIAFGLL